MRTRIALVAIISIALITVTLLSQAVSVQPAHAATRPLKPATARHRDQLTAIVNPVASTPAAAQSTFVLGIDLLSGHPVGVKEVTPVIPPPPVVAPAPVVTDTVTPAQRAAWERVAMCEEGGNWASDGSRFSGGLGITRANWDNYGGQQYAPEGAMATEDQQIMVAERIQYSPPDQDGCGSW